MDFSSDANADFEGLLEVNRGICMPQMAEKTEPDAPPNCAVLPKKKRAMFFLLMALVWRKVGVKRYCSTGS